MSREQEIRSECLMQLYGSRPLPLAPAFIQKQARRQGYDYVGQEIIRELHFLLGQNLATSVLDPVTGETRYAITSAGILAYESNA